MKIEAKDGYTYVRIHDNFNMGDTIYLGYDYSTGVKRLDKEEYYKQIKKVEEETNE